VRLYNRLRSILSTLALNKAEKKAIRKKEREKKTGYNALTPPAPASPPPPPLTVLLKSLT
jgi:hypothetical protein